jgi:hypothetical protein
MYWCVIVIAQVDATSRDRGNVTPNAVQALLSPQVSYANLAIRTAELLVVPMREQVNVRKENAWMASDLF